MVKTTFRIARGIDNPMWEFDTYREAMEFFTSDAMNGQPTDGWAITQVNRVYSEK